MINKTLSLLLMTLIFGIVAFPVILTAGDSPFHNVECGDGVRFQNHLQGVCTDQKDKIYWSFTTALVMTDSDGKIQKQIPVANHHGDLCYHDGQIYVAVNLGKFNDPKGNADSWVYVYKAEDLSFVSKHEVQQVFHGAGGMSFYDGHFYVVGGLPDSFNENYVYEYDKDFHFIKKHVITSGHTRLGIQTASFAHGKWWFGCYGSPQIMLVTDPEFKMIKRKEFNCSLGIEGLPDGKMMVGLGNCVKGTGCNGRVEITTPEELLK